MNLGLPGGPLCDLVNCLNSCEPDSLMASTHFHEVFAWTDKTVYLKVSCIMPGIYQALIHFLHLFSHNKLNPYLWFLEWGRANLWQRKEKGQFQKFLVSGEGTGGEPSRMSIVGDLALLSPCSSSVICQPLFSTSLRSRTAQAAFG